MKELTKLVLENMVSNRIDRKVATEILGLLKKKNDSREIAIIGISFRFPLAKNIKEFWGILANGTDCIHELSSLRQVDCKRISYQLNPHNKNTPFVKGGFLDEVDQFDNNLFRISPREASLMDPHQRLFLETAWSAIEDAGYGGVKLNGSKTGIYLGYNSWPIYGSAIFNTELEPNPTSLLSNDPSLLPSRVAYLLNLRGSSMSVNTACSSSLVAIHLACQAIRSGECEMALAGGVKINLNPFKTVSMGLESADCKTKTFDDQSDGTGFGEGVAAVLLKPLNKALKDRDQIYAVIKGSALNQDGSSIGLTAPNVEAQEQVILDAWEDAGIDPKTISYIEAHGTGTQFGDMIEIEGIRRAFRRYTNRKQFCAIGTVKTNIGHLDSASGMASLMKAVLALNKKQIPPSIHFNRPNRKINFADSPVFVNDRLRSWEKGDTPRRCGLSAFGFSGCNCHIILEEAPDIAPEIAPETTIKIVPRVLALSAATESALKELIGAYQTFLTEVPAVNIDDLCYTANTGRGHYSHRLLLFCEDYDDLKAKINRLSRIDGNGLTGPEILYGQYQIVSGNKLTKETGELTREEKRSLDINAARVLDKIATKQDLGQEELAQQILELGLLYIQGADFQWERIYQDAPKQKLSIPGYPFQRERCWFESGNLDLDEDKITQVHPVTKSIYHAELKGREHYSETEQKLAEIWAEILGFKEISVTEDFCRLGGDSLTMTLLTSRINQKFNVELSLRQLFESSTIEAIGEIIDKAPKNIYASIEFVPKKEYYPVSAAQKRLYILELLKGVGTSYNISGVFEITGKMEKERFEKTFQQLIERHESFRTSFELIEGEPVQRIHPEVGFRLNYQELAPGEASIEEKIAGIIQNCIQPFDLRQAPLMRAGLLKISDNKHLLIFDMHHIIADGISVQILIRDFAALYNGETLPNLRIQYKDFTEWQHQIFKGETINRQESYWLNKFRGEIPVLNLPTDYPRPLVQSFAGARMEFEVEEKLIEGLKRLAQENGATLYMVLLAVFNVLLMKYTGQEDIIIGTPTSGRQHVDLENIIGMFVNTLVMRNHPGGEKTFQEFLAEVKAGALQAYENQDYQFEELVEKLNIRRDISRNPLFDTLFVLQNQNNETTEISGLTITPYMFENRIAKFDLTLQAIETKNGIYFTVEYCTKLFQPETIRRMSKHIIHLVDTVVNNSTMRLSEFELITEEEKQQILHEFNDTKAEYRHDKTIQKLFEEQAERLPENIAIIYEDRQMTYRELNQKANQLARVLRKKGVQAESIVGIIVERSLEMIIGILGILKAGGAYLPIDPEYPEERIKFMLTDSGAGIVLTQSHLKEKCIFEQEIIDLENEAIYDSVKTNLKVINQPQDLAYVIYTSGSTGKPKGVMVEHYSLVNRLIWMQKKYPINQNDTILQKTPYIFDVSVWELLWWIIGGAKLSILIPRGEKDPQAINAAIYKNHVTTIHFVPSMLTSFLERVEKYGNIKELESLHHVFASGEALHIQQVNRFNRLFNGKAHLHNLYGPTEATVDVSYYDCILGQDIKTVPIGKPIDNISLYIFDPNEKLCPVGITGELYISGDGVARGYLNRTELTAEKFVTNPFIPGERMYKTGDLARWLPDGNIEYLGRTDHQVKIRGFRIELEEIESQLVKYEGIQEAVVISREDKTGVTALGGTKYLCAYLTATKDLNASKIREYLSNELPDYMIPSYFVQLKKLPLTPNGKLDRKALPEPEENLIQGTEYEAPRTETELTLVRFWIDLLEAVQIGINDNFFAIGGHSLNAMVLVSRIHKELNVEIPLEEIFKKPTIKELAQYIDDAEKNIYHAIKPVPKREYYTVSSAQKRLFVLDQLEEVGTSYNISGTFEVIGKMEQERFEKTIKQLIERHESFRTSFELFEGEPVQRIHSEVVFGVNHQELTPGEASFEETINRIIQEFIQPFDLSQAPLVRVKLVKISDNRSLLMFDMHHIIADGASLNILIRDFAALYNGETLTDLKIQYKDFSEWQREILNEETVKQQEAYWLNQFAGEIPVLNLPTDYPRPVVQSFKGESIRFELNHQLTENLIQLAIENNTTLFMVLLTGFYILLSKYTGQEDIIIGITELGRHHSDLENIIGMFVNTLAIRSRPIGDKTFGEFLKEVKENVLNAYKNQEYQFEKLVSKLKLTKDRNHNPLFDVCFNMVIMDFDSNIALENLEIKPFELKSETTKFNIIINVFQNRGGLNIQIEYQTVLFKHETIENFANHYVELLKCFNQMNSQLKQIEIFNTVIHKKVSLKDEGDFNF